MGAQGRGQRGENLLQEADLQKVAVVVIIVVAVLVVRRQTPGLLTSPGAHDASQSDEHQENARGKQKVVYPLFLNSHLIYFYLLPYVRLIINFILYTSGISRGDDCAASRRCIAGRSGVRMQQGLQLQREGEVIVVVCSKGLVGLLFLFCFWLSEC